MRRSGAGFGAATLVMLFSVLCLTVFAVLSLSAARRELALSQRYAESTQAYYAADARALETLAALRGGTSPDALRAAGTDVRLADGALSYAVEAGGGLLLRVRLDAADLSVLSWAVENDGSWTEQDELRLWNGD